VKIYLSHSIRGVKGSAATQTDMKNNCDRIKGIANTMREQIAPEVEIYVPAEHEDFVGIAFRDEYLSEKSILEIDCKIIGETCNAVIVNVPEDDELQGGRLVEYNYAIEKGIPVCVFSTLDVAIDFIAAVIMEGG